MTPWLRSSPSSVVPDLAPTGPCLDQPARMIDLTSASTRRPSLLLISSLYPTVDRPEVGPFVARRVDALRRRGVHVEVVAAREYRSGPIARHIRMLMRSLTAPGSFVGVESHVLLPAGLIGVAAARARHIPHVTYAHGSDVIVTARRSRLHRSAARLVARSASAVVTNSRYTASFIERLGITPAVISPGVDLFRFSPGSRGDARERTGLPAEARIAMFVGRLSERKGADVFAEAVSNAAGWRGVIVGTGELEPTIVARHPAIVRAGAVPSDGVPDWLRSADVVVVPSRDEPLGLAAIEALACGIPVIASDVGGLAETIRGKSAGVLVPPGDVGAVTAALERLANDDIRAAYAAAAPASVEQHSIELATDAMAAVWAGLGVDL